MFFCYSPANPSLFGDLVSVAIHLSLLGPRQRIRQTIHNSAIAVIGGSLNPPKSKNLAQNLEVSTLNLGDSLQRGGGNSGRFSLGSSLLGQRQPIRGANQRPRWADPRRRSRGRKRGLSFGHRRQTNPVFPKKRSTKHKNIK